jgi:hypothetical protein
MMDDLDGSQADETVRFAVDGNTYEIDLSEKNAAEMRRTFDRYIEHARKAARGDSPGTNLAQPSPLVRCSGVGEGPRYSDQRARPDPGINRCRVRGGQRLEQTPGHCSLVQTSCRLSARSCLQFGLEQGSIQLIRESGS